MKTADLSDAHPGELAVVLPGLVPFGRRASFYGPITTVNVSRDNVLVRRTLEGAGEGRVLVVDGGGALDRALLGDNLAALAMANGWTGIVVNGAIRDRAVIDTMEIGVRALATCPVKSEKHGEGAVDVPVTFLGVTFSPGAWLYADEDGVLVAPHALDLDHEVT